MAAPEPNTPGKENDPPEGPARAAARLAARLASRAIARARQDVVSSARGSFHRTRAAARWLWVRRPPGRRVAAIAFVAGAAVTGATSILSQARLRDRLPSSLDWAAARALVERDARPGDAVALSPPWVERARETMPATVAVLSSRRYAGEDLVGVRRVWLLSLPDAPRFSWDAEVDLLERASRSNPPVRFGALEVTRYDLAFPTLPLAFLPDRMAHADVSLGSEPCLRDGAGAFECPRSAARVVREEREVDGEARPCLVTMIDPAAGAPLVVKFPELRLGRMVHGHAGPVAGGAGEVPIRIAVQVDDDEVGAAEIHGGRFSAFRIDTTRFAGEVRSVSLVLTPSGPAGEICLDAVTMP